MNGWHLATSQGPPHHIGAWVNDHHAPLSWRLPSPQDCGSQAHLTGTLPPYVTVTHEQFSGTEKYENRFTGVQCSGMMRSYRRLISMLR
jgi:hypothetical protein